MSVSIQKENQYKSLKSLLFEASNLSNQINSIYGPTLIRPVEQLKHDSEQLTSGKNWNVDQAG